MKKTILLAFLSSLILTVSAETIKTGGIQYDLNNEDKTATVAKGTYSGDIIIPPSFEYQGDIFRVIGIGTWAFDCQGITSLSLPNSIHKIESFAFFGCSHLKSIIIPDSVIYIGQDAFTNCKELETVYITDLTSWLKINFGGTSATPLIYATDLILNNEVLTDVVIPESITSLNDYAFYNYSKLNSVSLHNNIDTIGNFSFCKTGIETVIIPDNLGVINGHAFTGCDNLKTVVFGNSIRKIKDAAFSGCNKLTTIYLPDSVSIIGNAAFKNCTNLKTIRIGKSIKEIGSEAFQYCTSIEDFYVYSDNIPSLVNNNAFWRSSSALATLHVPEALVETYKNRTEWNRFGTIIALTEEDTSVDCINLDIYEDFVLYDITGNKMDYFKQGINLIKQSNGRVLKIYHK